MKKELTIAIIGIALITSAASQVDETNNQDSNVTVTVSDVTALDVRPSSLSYTGVTPGADQSSSDSNYEHIELENIGSARIGEIYAQGTMPTTQPFGTDATQTDPAQHNTGNFVTLSLATANDAGNNYDTSDLSGVTTPHYLNRVEYFEGEYPTYIEVNDGSDNFNSTNIDSGINNVDVGRFRVGGAEYFFAVYETSSDVGIRIGDTPHTSTQLGTTDLTNDGEDYTTYDTGGDLSSGDGDVYLSSGHQFASFDTTTDEFTGQSLVSDGTVENTGDLSDVETRTYDLLIDTSNDFVMRTKFNVAPEIPGGYNSSGDATEGSDNWDQAVDTGAAREYILDAGSQSNAMQPGENFPVNFGIQVPQGVDQNAIQEGTVTIYASSTID